MISPPQNVCGKHTATDILLESRLQRTHASIEANRQHRLIVPILQAELDFALTKEIPECNGASPLLITEDTAALHPDQWQTLPLYRNVVRIVARVSARVPREWAPSTLSSNLTLEAPACKLLLVTVFCAMILSSSVEFRDCYTGTEDLQPIWKKWPHGYLSMFEL